MYPACYRFWVEYELPNGSWTTVDFKAGWSTLEGAMTRIQRQRPRASPGRRGASGS